MLHGSLSGSQAISGWGRKRDAANRPFTFGHAQRAAGVLIGVIAQHVPDHRVAKNARRVVIKQVNAAQRFPVAAIGLSD
jgi:hypothetical protein